MAFRTCVHVFSITMSEEQISCLIPISRSYPRPCAFGTRLCLSAFCLRSQICMPTVLGSDMPNNMPASLPVQAC